MPIAESRRFDPLAYRDPAPNALLIRALGPINRHLMLRGLLCLRTFEIPPEDLTRLRSAVNPETAAFLGPNHPEFMTDWLVDKEISRLVSPLMAHWASYEIVNGSPLAQRFWLANNLVANVPGGGGKALSVRWALAGHGVLLHPEGTATWQADRVGPLLPGIVDMAWEAAAQARARGLARRVFMVPIVWKLPFAHDATPGLRVEMAWIVRELRLTRGWGTTEARFAALMRELLARQCNRLGLPWPGFQPRGRAYVHLWDAAPEGSGYFAEQAAVIQTIRDRLAQRHGEVDADPVRAQHQLRRAIRELAKSAPEVARRDRALLAELQRLTSFDPALYDTPSLTQEQVAETLKRVRTGLVVRGAGNALHNLLPVAVAPRQVHVRVLEPIDVGAAAAESGDEDAIRARLLALHRSRLQEGVDAIRAQIAPVVDHFRLPNPLYSGR